MASFDYESLTLGEVEWIEDYSEMSITAISDEEKPKGKALIALITVMKRRDGGTFNPADAQKLTMRDVNALLAPPEDDDPKEN